MKIKDVLIWGMTLGVVLPVSAQLVADPWKNVDPVPAINKKQTQEQTTVEPDRLGRANLDYVGENTTWNTAMGQAEIAPDANITNMLLMTQHLRNMGYQIPEGLDNLINTAPKKLRNEIYAAMNQLKNSDHPIAKIEGGLAGIFEKNTGLSLENLIMNSLRIIDNRR